MTLPRKAPLVWDWNAANFEKRDSWCRVCGRSDRKIELAHIIGRDRDTRDAVEQEGTYRGRIQIVRLAKVNPDRVISLCGPQQQTGTCHHALDHHTGEIEIWDHLTDAEKQQAVKDAGSLGQAMHRCCPRTWEDRLELTPEGELREVAIG